MNLGLDYASDFNGLKSMTTYETIPLSLYADGIPFDLSQATQITVQVGGPNGYVGRVSVDVVNDDRSLFPSGIISFQANDNFMQQLPPNVYFLEVWVQAPGGQMIFPSDGVLPFTVDNNLLDTSVSGVSNITLYEFQQNFDELANLIQNNQATLNVTKEQIDSVINHTKEHFEQWKNDLTNQYKNQFKDFLDQGNKQLSDANDQMTQYAIKSNQEIDNARNQLKSVVDTSKDTISKFSENSRDQFQKLTDDNNKKLDTTKDRVSSFLNQADKIFDKSVDKVNAFVNTSGNRDVGIMNHREFGITKGFSRPQLLKDDYNQTYHMNSPVGWMNDIQTIVRVNDHWNIYYLNNNNKDREELSSEWYVMQTTDFKTFNDAGIAVHRMPALWGHVFTGSIIKNKQDDGHVINPNVPSDGFLAFFCGYTGIQQMYCAWSDADALEFHPLDASLVLKRPAGTDGFRDGKVIYNPYKKEILLYMVRGDGNDGTEIRTYTSSTGEENTWRDTGKLDLPAQTFTNSSPGAYECPLLIRDIKDKTTGEKLDVLVLSGNTGPDGLGMFYITGKIDNDGIFQRKRNTKMKRLDFGLDAYAGNFTETTSNNDVINMNWIGSWSRPYMDFMKNKNNYHLGYATLARRVSLNNGVLENEIIEPVSDTLLNWFDTNGVNLHEKSSRAKIVARFNDPINDNKFSFDYGDGLVEISVTNQKIFIGQPRGIFSVPNGATCFLDNPIKEIVFYLDKSSIEVYIPSEKKVMTHMMLSDNQDVKFNSSKPMAQMLIRQFNENCSYGSIDAIKPAQKTDTSSDKGLLVSEGSNPFNVGAFIYRGKWVDDLASLNYAQTGYYSLEGNKRNGPTDFSGYGNVEVTHNDSDTFVTLKSERKIWVAQYTFGDWGEWTLLANGSGGGSGSGFTYRKKWTDDLLNLNTAKEGYYSLEGNTLNTPKGFSGYGNVEVTHNDSDTFVFLKGDSKIWTNQFTFGAWGDWQELLTNEHVDTDTAYVYRDKWTKGLDELRFADPGYYSLEDNRTDTPDNFGGYGNVYVTHNKSDTFVTLRGINEQQIGNYVWENHYGMGHWMGWTQTNPIVDKVIQDNKNIMARRGDWTNDILNLNDAPTGIYALPGNTQHAPDEFSGYGNVEVTHNNSDTFLTLKGTDNKGNGNNVWINQYTFKKWVGWYKVPLDAYQYRGTWTQDILKTYEAKDGYYTLNNNSKNAPDGFSGWGILEVKHNEFTAYIKVKSLESEWLNAYDDGRWRGWKETATLNTVYEIKRYLDSKESLMATRPVGLYGVSANYTDAPNGFDGYGLLKVEKTGTDTFLNLIDNTGNSWTKSSFGAWKKNINNQDINYKDNVIEIDNAFNITVPGTYTHPFGKHMANVPYVADQLNDYTIIATGWKKINNSEALYARGFVRKLTLIDVEGHEWTSTYNGITDRYSQWVVTGGSLLREDLDPNSDVLKLEGPAIYHSHWGYQETLKNFPGGNGAATIKVEGFGIGEIFDDGKKITVINSWGDEYINQWQNNRWLGWQRSIRKSDIDQLYSKIAELENKLNNK